MSWPVVVLSRANVGVDASVGSPDRRTVDVIDKLAALRCDPITGMALMAMNENNPVELRARMFSELAQYVAPKRKAMEHSAGGGIEEWLARIGDG
jgi:hypothetical protein